MILYAVLATCVGIAACTLIDIFFDKFAQWLRTLPKLLESVIEGFLIGCKTFVDLEKSRFGIAAEISKNYSKLGDKWQITTASREIPINEIPEEIMARSIYGTIIDVTDDLEMTLR